VLLRICVSRNESHCGEGRPLLLIHDGKTLEGRDAETLGRLYRRTAAGSYDPVGCSKAGHAWLATHASVACRR
jgi:hypothetical protein